MFKIFSDFDKQLGLKKAAFSYDVIILLTTSFEFVAQRGWTRTEVSPMLGVYRFSSFREAREFF